MKQSLAVSALMALGFSNVRANCGALSCPVDAFAMESRTSRWIRLGYEFEHIHQDEATRGPHDEYYAVDRLHRLAGSAALSERLGVGLQLPFLLRTRRRDHDAWSFAGLGDLVARARWAVVADELGGFGSFSAIAGAKLPTGRGDGIGAEEAGSLPARDGSYDLIVGAAWHKRSRGSALKRHPGPLTLQGRAIYQASGPGSGGSKGHSTLLHFGATYRLSRAWSALGGLDVASRWRESTGGDYLYFSPGALWTIAEGLEAWGLIQLPLHQRTRNLRLVSSHNLAGSITYRWDF